MQANLNKNINNERLDNKGLVIASYGRHYLIEPAYCLGTSIQCFARGKKTEIAVGDLVNYEMASENQGIITKILPRKTLLKRSNIYKTKLFAANIDQLVFVLATEPKFSEDLLARSLIAAEDSGLKPIIILNKIDIEDKLAAAKARLQIYRELNYQIIEVSALQTNNTIQYLKQLFTHQSSLLLGQSGTGKSTLINLLIPNAQVLTQEISQALATGKHTTTLTRLFHLPNGGTLLDSPGFQEFGLSYLSEGRLERAFVDFRPYLGQCRFHNCHHINEPDCAILKAVKNQKVTQFRYMLYAQLLKEIDKKPY